MKGVALFSGRQGQWNGPIAAQRPAEPCQEEAAVRVASSPVFKEWTEEDCRWLQVALHALSRQLRRVLFTQLCGALYDVIVSKDRGFVSSPAVCSAVPFWLDGEREVEVSRRASLSHSF
jgi:hypothetical protein